jgi:septal ring factor EnvC (AmiA/AmiB activator)
VTDGTTVALVFGGLAAVLNVGLVVWRGGALAASLESMRAAQDLATAESKRQHEETRREIAALREHRVASDATAEHLRADVDALHSALAQIRADLTVHTEARHQLREQVHTMEGAVEALRREAPRAPRSARRG